MSEEHSDIYYSLKAYGHSPQKAQEIILDAQRGDEFARRWIAIVRDLRGFASIQEKAS